MHYRDICRWVSQLSLEPRPTEIDMCTLKGNNKHQNIWFHPETSRGENETNINATLILIAISILKAIIVEFDLGFLQISHVPMSSVSTSLYNKCPHMVYHVLPPPCAEN
jgi:hypothetical protein